jgi:hypothetical protein
MATQKIKEDPREAPPLCDLVSPEDYVRERAHVFPSVESWRWWFRKNRDALFEAGAVLEIAGRTRVVSHRCDAAVFELANVGRKTNARAAAIVDGSD